MRMLEVSNLAFGYAQDALFSDVTFALEEGQRAALVAPNGAGKSTLLRIIAGELKPDHGASIVKKGAKVAYFRQSHELSAEGSVRDAFLSAFREIVALAHDLRVAEEQAASGTEQALSALATAAERYHVSGGDAVLRRVDRIATHLGFAKADLDRPVASLSGGERGRLQLGTVLAQEADLLLLDEPTNHLDLDTIRWLEGHLVGMPAAMLVVSHDRAFMDAVCPHTCELGRRSFRAYPLHYTQYAEAREVDLERERALVERQDALIAKTEDFIRKNIAGQKTKQAQSRRKMLDKLEREERPEDIWQRAEKVHFRFADAPRTGDVVLECAGLGAERGGRVLFEGLDLLVRRGERVAIVGKNGAGKSTLLRMLAGVSSDPGDRGSVRRGTNLREGYFDQHLGSLDESKTPVEEIRSVRGDLNVEAARDYLGRFRFSGDDHLRRIVGFSGGEQSRLALAKMLLEPRNLLFLDEPTNHLDIPAARILEEALAGFEGTVLLVSHDRKFLEAVATRVVHVHGEAPLTKGDPFGVELFVGGFVDFVRTHERRAAAQPDPDEAAAETETVAPHGDKKRSVRRSAATVPPAPGPGANDPEAKKRAFEAERAAQRARERKEKRFAELERLIASSEAELSTRREALKNDPGADWERLAAGAREEQALSKKVDELIREWAALGEELGLA
jgi:ATP-binding cassette subfamily F protein 3